MENKYEIKEQDGWFSVFNTATGELRHIGGTTREQAEQMKAHVIFLDTPAGETHIARVSRRSDNWTGD